MSKARPQPIADVLAELMSRRGYARQEAGEQWTSAWSEAAGPLLAAHTRVGGVRRGVVEVIVANSTLMQELTFQKAAILTQLRHAIPQEPITDLRLRVGPVR